MPVADEPVLSVFQLTHQLKEVLETAFPSVWVAGEISNFSRPQSGHCYFTLKDDQAQLRAVIWKGVASRLPKDLHDGLEVVCRGRIDLYPPRGSYQLVVERLELQGVGALEAKLRELRDKLDREGLFRPDKKRPLPLAPRRIGVATSPTGAAIRDFLQVLRRRWQGVDIQIFPCRVQGEGATEEIVSAIQLANRVKPQPELLVLTRGGGSLEDLWCFNDERVVRAVAASAIPTVSGVGHEIDVTLTDMAADVRALTPSEAAERVAPHADEMASRLSNYRERLHVAVRDRVQQRRRQLEGLASRPVISRPLDWVNLRSRQVDDWSARLHRAAESDFAKRQHRLASVVAKLEALSPLAVLSRGYTVTQDARSRKAIRSVGQLQVKKKIITQFDDGSAESRVEKINA